MATAQDILGWITELLSGQGQRNPALDSATGGIRPPPLVPRLDTPPGGDMFADAPDIRRLAGMDRRLLGFPPLAPRPDTFPADATDVPPSITGAGTRRMPDVAGKLGNRGPGGIGSDIVAAPVPDDPTRDVPPFTTGTVRREPDNPELSPEMARLIARNENLPFNPPPLAPRPPRPTGERNLRQPDLWDYVDTALAGMAGGRPVLSTIRDRADSRNATYDALIGRGASPDLARAITTNQALFAPILPQIFAPRTKIIEGRLVRENPDGSVTTLADFSRFILGPGQHAYTGGGAEIASGGPERRHLSAEDIRRLRNEGTQLSNIGRLGSTFQNNFAAPNLVAGGDISNWIARNTTHGTGPMREAARWWQDYTRNSELFERHEMFGAALTPTEQAAWRAADINPNMEPGMVRANLATRHRILTQAVQRYAQSLAASGYDATAIASAFGVSPGALGIRSGGRHDDALTAPPGGGDFRVLGVR